MATLDAVQKALAELGRTYGISDLALDPSGGCSLQVNDTLVIDFQYDEGEGRLILESQVGHVPADDPQPVLERVAHANRLGVATAGGTLALGPDNEIVLIRELSQVELGFRAVELALQEHVEGLTTWAGKLNGEPEGAPAPPARAEDGMIDPSRMA